MNTYNNPVLEKLPLHLQQYIVEQHYERYTPIDHAIWRYVMRQNYSYLKDVAFYPYIPGLKKAGLSIEKVPNLQSMNDHLKQLGWGAVTVDGFIPPLAFMEFQAYRVLVIAADIRQLDHIEYTPAPDIIHESSGHAPIIAEPEYAAYLQLFGTIGSKAMFSAQDFELYEAIRHLSIIKEQSGVSKEQLQEAETRLDQIQNNMGEPSEMALLSRLHWWTVEYGLIGTIENPKIYGAGLLSSIGESASCMRKEVTKIPYSLDAINYPYDITKPQPQLFVTPDFQTLLDVLEDFSNSMAFRKGGMDSLKKAIECKNVCTIVLSSGLQISGVFIQNTTGQSSYLQTRGATALSYGDKELPGHGKSSHIEGFGSPFGKLRDSSKPLEEFTPDDWARYQQKDNEYTRLCFENHIQIKGIRTNTIRKKGKNILLTFQDCTVTDERTGQVIFQPEWGSYDLAVGTDITSVFSGAADKDAFEQLSFVGRETFEKQKLTNKEVTLQNLYAQVREFRTSGTDLNEIKTLWGNLQRTFSEEWLAPLELLEVVYHFDRYRDLQNEIRDYLKEKAQTTPAYTKLIQDGLKLIGKEDIRLINE